ncbi:MAG: Txe/YoeB family addiction module toxin [Trueperaceae bacterium]|nr:Txe/YoeB family addiction module toxin [Trueperaceae bacterium]
MEQPWFRQGPSLAVSWEALFTRRALKDLPKLEAARLDGTVQDLVELLKRDPFHTPPPFKKLRGELSGSYSRRINRTHRLVYDLDAERRQVYIRSIWSHYGE